MTEQDLKNNEIIDSLVSDHFSLSESGLKLFKNALNNEREKYIDENILKILGPDFRAEFPLNDEIKEELDESWVIFKRTFNSFIDSYEEENNGKKLEYSNYSENKITIDGQEVKLFKYIKKWSLQEENSTYLESIIRCARSNIPGVYWYKDLNEIFKKTVEFLGTMKIPSQSMKLVISCNFADWFLVSTGENSYSSCLNLESETSSAFWTGLPGLVVDKNRILIYITDGKTKEYEGIKVNRIISRTWGLIDKYDTVYPIRFYPSGILGPKILSSYLKTIGINLFDRTLRENDVFMGKYRFSDIITNWNDKSVYIFQDNTEFTKFGRIVSGQSGFYSLKLENGSYSESGCEISKETGIKYTDGLQRLIKDKLEIKKFERDPNKRIKCSNCDFLIDEEDSFIFDGRHFCHFCFNGNIFVCSTCSCEISPRSAFIVDNQVYCERHFSDRIDEDD